MLVNPPLFQRCDTRLAVRSEYLRLRGSSSLFQPEGYFFEFLTFSPSLCQLESDFSGFLTSRDGQARPGELRGGHAAQGPVQPLQIIVWAPGLDFLPGILPEQKRARILPKRISKSEYVLHYCEMVRGRPQARPSPGQAAPASGGQGVRATGVSGGDGGESVDTPSKGLPYLLSDSDGRACTSFGTGAVHMRSGTAARGPAIDLAHHAILNGRSRRCGAQRDSSRLRAVITMLHRG